VKQGETDIKPTRIFLDGIEEYRYGLRLCHLDEDQMVFSVIPQTSIRPRRYELWLINLDTGKKVGKVLPGTKVEVKMGDQTAIFEGFV